MNNNEYSQFVWADGMNRRISIALGFAVCLAAVVFLVDMMSGSFRSEGNTLALQAKAPAIQEVAPAGETILADR